MESSATPTTSAQARRTNPSRSKRGGPGVGTSDVDVMILESYKRKLETEPLIPADTPLFLTTNAASISEDKTSNGDPVISINIVANDRYFDRPEVLKAFREQELIQTPDFWPISESSSVGGRFRPRGAEDEREETSDTAYEKRHKKFETFEKRQRLREKDKLKHEHYKLKERIEQLRSMDSSAFMALPFSFGVEPDEIPAPSEVDPTLEAPAQVQAQTNGAPLSTEGERRKKAMLEHAISLEKRYSYLLPPDRVRKPTETRVEEEESETEKATQAGSSKNESIKFRLPPRTSHSATPASSPAAIAIKPPRKARGPGKQFLSSRAVPNSVSSSVPPTEPTTTVSSPYVDVEMHTPEPQLPSPSFPPAPTQQLPDVIPAAVQEPPLPKPRQNGRGRPPKNARVAANIAEVAGAAHEKVEKAPPGKTLRPRPVQVQIADDGESEKEPSEDGNDEILDVEVAVDEEETTLHHQVPYEAPGTDDAHMLGPDEVLPEVRELSTRLEQTGVAGTLSAEAQQAILDELRHAQFVAEGPDPESISTRPAKRQKKMKARAQSVGPSGSQAERSPSVPPASAYTATGRLRKKMVPRGQQSQVYRSSTTGEEVRTMSFLLMAAIRSEGAKRNVEKRHNTSFGIPTPTFKEAYDFEIPEWLHYPEDEEPPIPIPDLHPPESSNIGDDAQQLTLPLANAEHQQPEQKEHEEHEESMFSIGRTLEDDIPISALREEIPSPKPTRALHHPYAEPILPQEHQPMPTAKSSEPQEEEMEAQPEVEEEDELEEEDLRSPTEHESEPGVSIRVLSQPRDSDEEQLEW